MAQFSLCWDIKTNICQGLSSLQQNGEFVDMTLAADGHLVKVHQMIIALASPYLKELITSANCKYPIIFLNKVSYTSLCAILEYVYTGEVLVAAEELKDFLQAAKELHIKGINGMSVQQFETETSTREEHDEVLFEVQSQSHVADDTNSQTYVLEEQQEQQEPELMLEQHDADPSMMEIIMSPARSEKPTTTPKTLASHAPEQLLQFTVSNQGSLQMILNRFVYFLKHTNKHTTQWRCVDYVSKQARCPAYVITEDNIVIKRVGVHTHTFHDKRILKKVRLGAVYSAIQEAERDGSLKRARLPRAADTDHINPSISSVETITGD